MQTVTTEDLEDLEFEGADPVWDYLAGVEKVIANGQHAVTAFRNVLAEGDAHLKQRFFDEEPVERLVRDRARLVDLLLRFAWKEHVGRQYKDIALIAVGGYGRGELNLCS